MVWEIIYDLRFMMCDLFVGGIAGGAGALGSTPADAPSMRNGVPLPSAVPNGVWDRESGTSDRPGAAASQSTEDAAAPGRMDCSVVWIFPGRRSMTRFALG